MKSFTDVTRSKSARLMFSLYTKLSLNRLALIRTVPSLRRSCLECNRTRVRHETCIVPKSSVGSIVHGFTGIQNGTMQVLQGNNSQFRTFCTSTRLSQKTELENLFPLRYIYVRTNVSFWEEYPKGIQFDVGYVDTKIKSTNNSKRNPNIVVLPSSVGSHMELLETLMTFAKLGYRVIIPNFPGTTYCRGKSKVDEAVCQLSVQEKTDFIKDFLKELGIEKVDMLITNGCSVYTGVSLCVFHSALFKSLVMINPTGLEPTQSMLPLWIHQRYTSLFDDRYVLQGLFKAIVAGCKKFTRKSHWDTLNVSTFSRTIAALSFADEKTCGEYFQARDIPRFAIFGEDSDSLDIKSTLEYLSLINIPQSSIKEMDEDNKIIKEGRAFNWNYGLHIRGVASDEILNKRTVVLRRELLNILKIIRPDLD